jgi:type IV pilus assembly protein PilV
MKAKQLLCPNAGFTLIESMLTMVILSIGMLALAGLQVSALRGNALSRRMATAISVAEGKLEQVKNTFYANIQAEAATQITASNLNFTQQVTVTNGPLANTKTVSVIVSWSDKSKTHTVPLATIIGSP